LVRPARAAWGGRAQGRKRRRHEIRQSRAGRPPLLVLRAFLAAFLRGGRTTRAAHTLLRAFARARAPGAGPAFVRAGFTFFFPAFARMPNALRPPAFGVLGDRPAADPRQRFVFENVRIIRAAGFLVL